MPRGPWIDHFGDNFLWSNATLTVLQRPVELFAYPNGDHNEAVAACVRRHYRAAVTASSGWIRRGADTHRLPRLAAPRGVLRLARRIYP